MYHQANREWRAVLGTSPGHTCEGWEVCDRKWVGEVGLPSVSYSRTVSRDRRLSKCAPRRWAQGLLISLSRQYLFTVFHCLETCDL